VVVVAPRWWTGGQPPPKIKFLKLWEVGFWNKLNRRFQVQTSCLLLEFLGVFWTFWAEQSRGLGFKGLGSSVTCPGLHIPIDNFTIPHLNSKGALEAWAECPRGVRIPSPLHFPHIHSEKNSATSNYEF
jgi:hypothetical protein